MEIIAIISNLVLAILTGVYVWLTHRLVRQATIANQQTQEAFRRQFQLATYPHLTCSVQRGREGKTEIVLRNSGSLPAVDTDILLLATYYREPLDASAFIQQFVKSDSEYKKRLFDGEDGMYSVYNHIAYSEVPQGKQVTFNVQAPVLPDLIYVLLQFRDITGVNYARTYWFFGKEGGKQLNRFRLGNVTPHTISVAPRIDFDLGLELVSKDGSDVSKIIDDGFISAWRGSIPSGHLKGDYSGVEDVGTWTDI